MPKVPPNQLAFTGCGKTTEDGIAVEERPFRAA
jgi:hypothetical protein